MHISLKFPFLLLITIFVTACGDESEKLNGGVEVKNNTVDTEKPQPLFLDGDKSFYGPKTSPKVISARARQFIIGTGLPIEKYKLKRISYSYLNQKWQLFYARKNIRMGGFLPIRIDDNNPDEIEFYE